MRRVPIALVCVWALFGSLAAPGQDVAGPRSFRVDDAWGRDSVQFRTSAPLEDIVGVANGVTGVLTADPGNLLAPGSTARIEVDLASIKTGITMRDGHVAKVLGVEKSPTAIFTLEKIKSASSAALRPNVTVDIVASGAFELNGVRKKIDVPARVTYVPRGGPFSQMRPGNFVRLTCEFDVVLSDFGVDRNGPVLPLQVGDRAHVTVAVLASDAGAEEAEAYRAKAIQYMGKARN